MAGSEGSSTATASGSGQQVNSAASALGFPVNIISGGLRPERPCDLCRKRKVKCFLELNDTACARCRTSGRECTFDEPATKRQKPMPPSDVRVDAPPRACISPGRSTSASAEGSARGTDSIQQTYSTWSQSIPSVQVDGAMPDSSALPSHHSSSIFKDEEPTLNLYDNSTVEHVGPSGDTGIPFSIPGPKLHRSLTQDEHADPVHFKIVDSPHQHHSSLPHAKPLLSIYDTRLDISLVIRALQAAGRDLVDIYLRSAHRAFPIINEERVVSRMNHLAASSQSLSSSDLSVLLLYISIMVVASHWRFLQTSSGSNSQELDMPLLRDFCKQTLPRELAMPRLVTVQSLLLRHSLLVSTVSETSMTAAWSGMGALVTAAQNLGLHRNPERWNIAEWEIQIRKKLWWAVYITEKWLAYSIGRSSLIQADDWTVNALSPADFQPSYDSGAARFIALSTLTGILSDIHASLFTPRSAVRLAADYQATRAITAPLFARLDAWTEAEEMALAVSEEGLSEESIETPCALQLAHFAVRVALHRALLRCGNRAERSVRTEAVLTMRNIANWLKTITSHDVLSVWWSFSGAQFLAITNFFLSLTTSASTANEFESLKKVLQGWRWQLRINLQSFPLLARPALQRLDELMSDSKRLESIWLHNKLRTPAAGNTRPGSPVGHTGEAMLDLARLASQLNGHQQGNHPQPAFSTETPSSFAAQANLAMSSDPSTAIDQIFDFQFPVSEFDTLGTGFSLEEFMSWGDPTINQPGLGGSSEQTDWVI